MLLICNFLPVEVCIYMSSQMRKAFLECAVAELVYKFDEKSNCKCLKSESTSKMLFNFYLGHIV